MIDATVIEGYLRDANPIPDVDDLDADEFARFVAAAHTTRAAVMQAPTQHPTQPTSTTPVPQQQRRRKAWAFALAFIVVLVGVGITALVLRTAEAPVSDEPVTETTVPETPAEPAPIGALSWSRVPLDESVFRFGEAPNIHDMTAGGPGLVAVGATRVGDVAGDFDATVLISPDGITWSRVPHDDAVFGGRGTHESMHSVAVGGPGLVAVGRADHPGEGPSSQRTDQEQEPDAGVWTSPDGVTWTRIPHDESVFGAAIMNSVTVGGPGFVAVGIGTAQGDESRDHAVAWTSPDGFTWTRVPDDETIFGGAGEEDEVVMRSVAAGNSGLIAVGGDRSGAAVWTSPDGLSWTRISHDETAFASLPEEYLETSTGGSFLVTVVAGGPGFVAVGEDEPPPGYPKYPAVWTSPDATTWSRVPHDEEVFGTGSMYDVAAGTTGLVAVGEGSAVAWTSPDGNAWTQVPRDQTGLGPEEIPGSTEIHVVTASGPGFVAIGEADNTGLVVWVAAPPD